MGGQKGGVDRKHKGEKKGKNEAHQKLRGNYLPTELEENAPEDEILGREG